MIQLRTAARSLRSARGALWAAVAVAALTLVGMVVYGQVQQRREDARVERVAEYIRHVNAVERGLTIELTRVKTTYRRFGEGSAALREMEGDLEQAVQTMTLFRRRISGLKPPADARRLHVEILRLADLELALVREVRDLGKALPAVTREAGRASAAARRLLSDLRGAKTLDDQAAGFQRYGRSLDGIATRYESLNAPPVIAPSLRSEARRLRRLAALAKETGAALAAEETDEARELSNRLANAAAKQTVVTKADRNAVAAYRRRIREVGEQEQAVAGERERLARALA